MSLPAQQAGGGASENARQLPTANPTIIKHLTDIFHSHADQEGCWSSSQIRRFAHDVQQQNVRPSAALDELLANDSLDVSGFIAWMTSSYGAASLPPQQEDLSWPLSSYFISSSHNTYLTGNQLSSDSSTKPYTDTLVRGGRCIEVDVWDGDESDAETSDSSSDDEIDRKLKPRTEKMKTKKKSRFSMLKDKIKGSVTDRMGKTSLDDKPASEQPAEEPEVAIVEPRVLHGYTLTKPVSFRAICIAIRESAFVASDLPVIVSLEVHCCPEQQLIMVKIMEETFAEMLVPESKEEVSVLPSLEELRHKILIKVKYVPPTATDAEAEEDEDEADDEPAPAAGAKGSQKPAKVIQELSRMGVYSRGVTFKSLAQPEAGMPTHIFSLAEKKLLSVYEEQPMELFNHNRHFLMRTYPWGLRISSSNLDPSLFWRKGVQVVALNWQKWDEGMMLQEAMFAGTGGYVRKPQGYLPEREGVPNNIVLKTLNLTVTFLAAQNVPLPPDEGSAKGFKPYIKAELHVAGPDEIQGHHVTNDGHAREGEYKVRTQTHRGRDLDLLGERLEFPPVPGVLEELSWLRFTVRDDEIGRDDLAAWACVRLDRLGHGYRFVHLLDCDGRLTDGAVLVKVEKTLS